MTAPGGAGRTPLSAEAALSGRDVVPVMNPAANPALQHLNRFGPGEYVYPDRHSDLVPAALAGGDQHVAAASRQP